MNYGFVKVAAAVPHVKVADCKFNVEKIESLIAVAEGKECRSLFSRKWVSQDIRVATCSDNNFCWKKQKWG